MTLPKGTAAATAGALPPPTRDYLSHGSLMPLWAAVRAKLERNHLQATGDLTLDLDEEGTDRLGGVLGRRVSRPATVRLDSLDAALRRSAAATGLLAVTEALTGPLTDQKAARASRADARASTAALLDAALVNAGVGDQAWVPEFVEGVRLAGTLSRAGDRAPTAILHAGSVLAALVAAGALSTATQHAAVGEAGRGAGSTPGWGLAELATRCTGDAHGLDSRRTASALVLRAAAAALGVRPPESSHEVRSLWSRLSVASDEVSGSVLVWSLQPPGNDAWSAMMRVRADLGLVTHLTLHELNGPAAGVPWARARSTVSVCENPQVLQAAARAGSSGALVCTSGDLSAAAWLLLGGLIERHTRVRYHGDFDWPGMAIAGRVLAVGAEAWRLGAADYAEAVAAADSSDRLPLAGRPVPTPWAPQLATAMSRTGVAVHEEALVAALLVDL